MSCYPSLETHPLKVLRSTENLNSQKVVLGPPDVYQQELKQKEDLLSEFNVREGFNCSKAVPDEHESGKDLGLEFVSRSFQLELNNYMQAVIVRNHNNNIKPDTTKRKVAVAVMYKDLQCIPAIEKSKEITNEWIVGLCDTAPYAELINKRIPYFHKKDDVLKEMNRYQVPITRAIWFIKVSAMLATIQAESNKKKTRSSVDSSLDWVAVLSRVLKDKLNLVAEKLVANSLDHEYELTIIEFEYLIRLLVAMYDEDLLDHTEVLNWLVSRCYDCDEPLMQFYLPFLLQFGDRFKESEIITRKLLFWACDVFKNMLSDEKFGVHRSVTDYYSEYTNCAMHRNVLFCLSGIITSLSLLCPSAIVWNNVKVVEHYLHGSPLDTLPCSLTALPSPPGPENDTIRDTLAKLEQFVMQRSLLVENQWKHGSFNSEIEQTATSLIHILDVLDRYDYNLCKEPNAMEVLATNLLSALDDKHMLLLLLCEWSTTPIRTGLHRPLIAVNVIEHLRQKWDQSMQVTLVQFLDTKAPFIDCPAAFESEPFRNLICLFGELIEREIFAIDDYVSYMIKRGIFEQCSQLPLPAIGGPSLGSRSPDPDRNSVENPDSVRSECSGFTQPHPVMSTIDYRQLNRHIQYLIHFPIPNNDDYLHEQNLRAQKLYCATKTREANKQFIKRLIKDITRFSNKRSNMFDIIQIEKSRKKARKDPRDESLLLDKLTESVLFRFKSLTYYDMELVMSQCVQSIVNSFNITAILGNKNQSMNNMYLPYPKIMNTLLSMIEYSCNYSSLIQTIDECLFNLSKLIEHLSRNGVLSHGSYLATYCSNYRINIIGFLFKYQSVLMLMLDSRNKIFHALFFMVYSQALSVANTPSYISRCTIALIQTIYQSCAIIKSQRSFVQLGKKMQRVIEPDRSRNCNMTYDDTFASDLIKGSAMPSTERYAAIIHDMTNNNSARLSFVVNCLLHVSRCQDTDQLIKINTMIVETTANVINLQVEFMTALFSLLMPFNALHGYGPFKDHFNGFLTSNDMTFYENISVLIATLLARQSFSFCDFLSRVICVAMAQGLEQLSPVSAEIVPTTRLASYILHRLFTMDTVTPVFANIGAFKLEDISLLTSSLQKVTTELLVDLLKMLAVHSDKGRLQDQECCYDQVASGPPAKKLREHNNSVDPDDNFCHMKIWNLTLRVLREICCVSWVRIKFSMETPSRLIRENVLIDKNISNSQARNLLNIIFQPKDYVWQASNTSKDIIDTMDKTFEHINLWSLHFDQMKIQLLLTQIPDDERKDIIDAVSRDTINLFQSQAEQQLSQQEDLFDDGASANNNVSIDINSSYLIPPLINKLPFDNLKRQLIMAAAERLESGKHFATHKNYQDKEKDLTKSSLILTYAPFISLLVFCLARDENKNEFLKSLSDQIEYYIDNAKETEKMPDDLRVKHLIHTSLKSRLALVGYLFDRIQDSIELSCDWSLLLSKLIIYGVVEMQSDHTQLFYTVVDMIGTLIHTLMAQPNISSRFAQISKKLRKEIADKSNYEGVELIKPFLWPCLKNTYDVVLTVPLRMPHKSQQIRLTLSEKSGKHGCAIQKKERLNPWEVIEGVKNLFSLSWFAAVSCEIPVLPIEEQANLMIGHDHPDKMIHSDSYYTSIPDIPHEDIKDLSMSSVAADLCMDFVSSNGPPSVANSITDNNNMINNNNNNMSANNNPGSVKIENTLMQPLQRSHSNASTASSEVSSSKRTKRVKRVAGTANTMTNNNHTLSPGLMVNNNNAAMMIRQGPLTNNGPMAMYGHPYGNHAMEYSNYQSHPMAMVDMQQQQQQQQQHPGFMQRTPFPPSVYEHRGNPVASVNMMHQNRGPRPNAVTQNLKTKIQQRQPQQDPASLMHPSFGGGGGQQMACLPPPYPGSSSGPGGMDDISSGATVGGPQAPYGAVMNNYQLQRQYTEPGMQQYLLHHQQQQQQQQQQQSRIQQQQQSRIHQQQQQQQQYDRPY